MSSIAYQKAKAFAIRITKLTRHLHEQKEFILSAQICRSGTSIGANLAESQCCISKKDFLNKVYIAFKECAETKYWLELLFKTGYINNVEFESLRSDCEELYKMLSATTLTTVQNLDR